MNEKQNCWEYMNCGREQGGSRVEELGICLTALVLRHDGINGGKSGGRYCWRVAGTFCQGEVQGTFASKISNCLQCSFLWKVAKEEGESFVFVKDYIK